MPGLLDAGGTLWMWRQNGGSQLGVAGVGSSAEPLTVASGFTGSRSDHRADACRRARRLARRRARQLAHCVVVVDGALYCFGANTHLQLGLGDAGIQFTQVPMQFLLE